MAKKNAAVKVEETPVEANGEVVEMHRGIRLDRVKSELLTKYMQENGLTIPTIEGADFKTNLIAMLDVYADHAATFGKKKSLVCTIGDDAGCGALSDKSLPACPVCGESDEGEEGTAEDATADSLAIFDDNAIVVQRDALDAAVQQINELSNESAKNFYEQGLLLKKIHDERLYKARRDASNMPVYRNFNEFMKEVHGITSRFALQLIEIASGFQQDDVLKLGVSKLLIVGRAEGEKREQLLTSAREGKGLQDLKQEAKTLGVIGSAVDPRKAIGSDGSAAPRVDVEPRDESKPKKGELTVTFQLGTTELLLTQEVGGKLVAKEELINGIVITYTVTKTGVLKIKRERAKS